MKRKTTRPTETDLLRQDLREAQDALFLAYQHFDFADAPELVDACIYEIKACRARLDYLYRLLRGKTDRAAAAREDGVWV